MSIEPVTLLWVCLASLAIAGLRYMAVLMSMGWQQRLTSDGAHYLAVAKGEPAPAPFYHRWLLPSLLGGDRKVWSCHSAAVLLMTGPALALYFVALGLGPYHAVAGVALYVCLTGVFDLNVWAPVLVDACAQLLAVVGATLALLGHDAAVIALAIVAGCVHETVPVWMALYAGSYVPLVGLGAVALSKLVLRPNGKSRLPRLAGYGLWPPNKLLFWKTQGPHVFAPTGWLLPWGVCLAGFLHTTWWLATTMGVAFGSLTLANANLRLLQKAAPVLIYHAMLVVPEQWLVAACILQWYLGRVQCGEVYPKWPGL